MAQNIVNISEGNEQKLQVISSLLVLNGKKKRNNSDLINECIEMLYNGITSVDEEDCLNIFNIKKNL